MADRVGMFENSEEFGFAEAVDLPDADIGQAGLQSEIRNLARHFSTHSGFVEKIKDLSARLTALHDDNPRMGKLLGSHRRWFMTQIGYAIHSSHGGGADQDGLTASRIAAVLEQTGIVSRNTVSSFVAEMLACHYLAPVPGTEERRSHPLMPTENAVAAMNMWLLTNMAAMDGIDGGARTTLLQDRPALFSQVQAVAAKAFLNTPEWRQPEPEIMTFLSMEAGALVLDGLFSMIEFDRAADGMLALGRINKSKMARRFRVSRASLDRVLKRAEGQGSIGRDPAGRSCMSRKLFVCQARRQALKFGVLDYALHTVIAHPGEPVRFL